MRPEKVKHTCSEYCSIDEKGWKIFVVKKKVEVSMSSFILHVVKHTLILHTLCQVWNKLWSFILYVVEKYLEDIFKIKYLEDFFSSKMKKMKMLHLEVLVKINDLEALISWGFSQDKLSSRLIIFNMQNLEECWYSRSKISNIWVLYTS